MQLIDYVIVSGGNESELRQNIMEMIQSNMNWFFSGPYQTIEVRSEEVNGVTTRHHRWYQSMVRMTGVPQQAAMDGDPKVVMHTRKGVG